MLNRYVYRELIRWKDKPNRKPLILRGARQVGKTTLVKMFAENYQQKINLNLENSGDRSFFEKTDNINEI